VDLRSTWGGFEETVSLDMYTKPTVWILV